MVSTGFLFTALRNASDEERKEIYQGILREAVVVYSAVKDTEEFKQALAAADEVIEGVAGKVAGWWLRIRQFALDAEVNALKSYCGAGLSQTQALTLLLAHLELCHASAGKFGRMITNVTEAAKQNAQTATQNK